MWQKLSAEAPPFVPQQRPKPFCLSNASYANAIKQFSEQLSTADETTSLTALLIGSGHRKLNPPDVDLLVVSSENVLETLQYIETHATFINNLAQLAESDYLEFYQYCLPPNSITRVIAALCRDGVTIKKAYTKERRSIITLHFLESIDIDINLQNNTFEKHAEKSDFSINTLYFDLKKHEYAYTHKHAIKDIATKTLRAAGNDANILFKNDITTLFRALRIIAEENYTPDAELLTAMTLLPATLPEALTTLNRSKLALGKKRIFCAGHAVNALNFLEENHLFDYVFPDIRSLDQKSEKNTILLFRKIAEASDAYFNQLDQAPNYPHAISAYIKKHRISPADSQNIMLCLFDYAIYGVSSNDQTMLSGKFSFFNTEIYDAAYPVAFNTLFEHILCLDNIFKEFIQPERSSPSLDSEHGNSTGYTSQECLSETNESQLITPDSDSEEDIQIESTPMTIFQESIPQSTDVIYNEPHTIEDSIPSINQDSLNDQNQNNDNRQKRSRKKNKKKHIEKPLTQEEQKIYDIYSNGIDLLKNKEHEKALGFLKQFSGNELCKKELKINAEKLLSIINPEDKAFSPKQFLSAAILFDSAGENSEAAKYYQKFFVEQAKENINLDKNYPEESLRSYSFVYIRLMLIFLELAKNSEKKEFYQMVSDKYRNEIILSPIVDKTTQDQQEKYVIEKSSENFSQKKLKNRKDKTVTPAIIPDCQVWLEEANRSFDRGLYYNSKLCYYSALKESNDIQLNVFLVKQIMICYVQLEMYEQSICFLEKQVCKFSFAKNADGAQVLERILIAISHQSCRSKNLTEFFDSINLIERIIHITESGDDAIQFFKANLEHLAETRINDNDFSPNEIKQKESFFHFKIATICGDKLLTLLNKSTAATEEVSNLFLDMVIHYTTYNNSQKTVAISTTEEKRMSIKNTVIRKKLEPKNEIVSPVSFFQPGVTSSTITATQPDKTQLN